MILDKVIAIDMELRLNKLEEILSSLISNTSPEEMTDSNDLEAGYYISNEVYTPYIYKRGIRHPVIEDDGELDYLLDRPDLSRTPFLNTKIGNFISFHFNEVKLSHSIYPQLYINNPLMESDVVSYEEDKYITKEIYDGILNLIYMSPLAESIFKDLDNEIATICSTYDLNLLKLADDDRLHIVKVYEDIRVVRFTNSLLLIDDKEKEEKDVIESYLNELMN